jgi:hypothetical protein
VSEWNPDMEAAPKDKPIWIGGACGHDGMWGMEPVRWIGPPWGWVNIYNNDYCVWDPTDWMHLPSPPSKPKHVEEHR